MFHLVGLLLAVAITAARAHNDVRAAAPTDIAVENLATALDTPWAIDFAPDGRIFLTERPGRIRVIERGRLLADPWLAQDLPLIHPIP
jgi:glucose/arabinose dehydrogenase